MSAVRVISIPVPARVTQEYIASNTPMGANLIAGGATFRVWAPRAKKIYVIGEFNNWTPSDPYLLQHDPANGHWTGFLGDMEDGTLYKFWIEGEGTSGPKRDPYARDLEHNKWPKPACIIRAANTYPWQDWTWRTPQFRDLMIYEFHVGTFAGPNREHRVAKFLDVVDKIPYLVDLGVNAIEAMPIDEYSTPRSEGYNGSDVFSPEMDYEVIDEGELDAYLFRVNQLLVAKGKAPLTKEVLGISINQLKTMVEICHLYGIAVIFDVVYNHASSDLRGPEQSESIYFFDRQAGVDPRNSLYFSEKDWCGPMFDFEKPEVRQFLIDNARFFTEEYHLDGFRYDEVTKIDQLNPGNGWLFCQDLNGTLNWVDPSAINIAEYWGPTPWVVKPRSVAGAGFHAEWHNGLRISIRNVLIEAVGGRDAQVHWQPVVDQLRAPDFPEAWQAVQSLEDHDVVSAGNQQRIAALTGGGRDKSRTWFATSRARVANGLLLTAAGIPMLFMGQEFYEDKQWSDDPHGTLINWEGLSADRTMQDFHRFMRELIALRRKQPALRSEGIATINMDDFNRVLAFQRWIPGVGRDVVVVASFNESTQYGYRIPFPTSGYWFEVFNSDLYENWVNPNVAGNGGGINADGPAHNGLSASADITIPANAILVFARDQGD